jgi:alpha-amylase
MSNDPSFDMATLDHAGIAGVSPFRSVSFVENHDTESRRDLIPKNIQPEDKPLAYAYILTSEGFPCVFYKDYSKDPECLGNTLQHVLVNLIRIHQNIAEGPSQQRWKDAGVFVFERLGGSHLLVGLNKDKPAERTLDDVQTGFGPNTWLHDYSGHAVDIMTDVSGRVNLTIPRNSAAGGYVCYSARGIQGGVANTPAGVTQIFEGAQDLDIKPADRQNTVTVSRIWVAAGAPIMASLTFDVSGWTATTAITLTLADSSGTTLTTKTFGVGSSGSQMSATAVTDGWYTFHTHSDNTPAADPKPAYKLTVSYTAPQAASLA